MSKIKPFKCAGMSSDRVSTIKKALRERVREFTAFDDNVNEKVAFIYFSNNILSWDASHSVKTFLKESPEEITFDQAMERVLSHPAILPPKKFDIVLDDKVLMRDTSSDVWEIKIYARFTGHSFKSYGAEYSKMIPYAGNEKYHGKTDTPDGWWIAEGGSPTWKTR